MKTWLFCLAISLFPFPLCYAGSSASEVVRQYCQLDFDGARLSSETWAQTAEFVSWQVEPGWDMATAVTGFEIISEKVAGNAARIQVLYFSASDESVEFTLEQYGDIWRIVSPVHQPHVSQKLLCEKFRTCTQGG